MRSSQASSGWTMLLLRGLAAPVGLALGLATHAGEPLPPPGKVAVVELGPVEGLGGLRKLALEKQPSLAAYHASLAAANLRAEALEQLRLAGLIRHDFPMRKSQAHYGILAAEARLHQSEGDTIYAVTRTYLSVVFAKQQLALADEALKDQVPSLGYVRRIAASILKDGDDKRPRPDVRQHTVDQIDSIVAQTRARRAEAEQGVARAMAALREAIGMGPDCPLPPPTFPPAMPRLPPTITKDEGVALALE